MFSTSSSSPTLTYSRGVDDPENFRLNVATYVLSWGRARRVTVLLRNAGLMESAQEMGKGEKEETFLSLSGFAVSREMYVPPTCRQMQKSFSR